MARIFEAHQVQLGGGSGRGVHRVTSCICMVSYCMYVSHICFVYFANTHASHTHSYTRTHTYAGRHIYKICSICSAVPCSQFPCYCYCSCSLFLTSSTFIFLLGTTSLYTMNYPKPPDKKPLLVGLLSLSLCLPLVHVMHRVGAADSVAGHPRVEAGHALHVDILHRRSQYALLLFVLFGRLRRRRRRRR